MLICDGSAVPANPGVNPSLTITAMTERAMGKIPVNESDAVVTEKSPK
jgi:cholesterol oxidase